MFAVASCGNGSVEESGSEVDVANTAPEVTFKPGAADSHTAKHQGPVSIAYKIIGTPIVGQPVGIELQVITLVESPAITLSYRVNDTTAMRLTAAQPANVSLAVRGNDAPSQQQVQVIPLREGRVYLNVSASIESEDGPISTVTAIPIQVGAASREIQDNGEVTLDENGELIRSLPATEN